MVSCLLLQQSLPAHQSKLESSGTTVNIAQYPSSSITVVESSGTTVDVAQSPCALIKVTKSPGTTVEVPSSSTKDTESSVPLITVSKLASSFNVVDSLTIIINAAQGMLTIFSCTLL